MPFQITDRDLEAELDKHAQRQPVPTTKGRMFMAVIRAALAAADARGIDLGQLIEEMRRDTPAHRSAA